MKRRQFLQYTGTASTLPVLLNGIPLSAIASSPMFNHIQEDNDRVLVLVQLNGGNDGLNTLFPWTNMHNWLMHGLTSSSPKNDCCP
jgi:uncharacterized protein (DUF1501 family)